MRWDEVITHTLKNGLLDLSVLDLCMYRSVSSMSAFGFLRVLFLCLDWKFVIKRDSNPNFLCYYRWYQTDDLCMLWCDIHARCLIATAWYPYKVCISYGVISIQGMHKLRCDIHARYVIATMWYPSRYVFATVWYPSRYVLATVWYPSRYVFATVWYPSRCVLATVWYPCKVYNSYGVISMQGMY